MRLLTVAQAFGTAASLVLVVSTSRAEIEAKHYRASQLRAEEAVVVEVLDVDRSICWFWLCSGVDVIVEAKVVSVERTRADLRPGDLIVISYSSPREDGTIGPTPLRILSVGENTPAFLERSDSSRCGLSESEGPAKIRCFVPAAMEASFDPLISVE